MARKNLMFYSCFHCSPLNCLLPSQRKQPTFHEVAPWALPKRRLSNERRNSILLTGTTQILVVLLIGWKKIPTNQKHYQDLGRDTSLAWNFWAGYSGVVLRGLKWRPRETFSKAIFFPKTALLNLRCTKFQFSDGELQRQNNLNQTKEEKGGKKGKQTEKSKT